MTNHVQQHDAFIALGSNIGDRENYLHQALNKLDNHPFIRIIDVSDIYETDPVGPVPQSLFLNMVAHIQTSLTPFKLLEETLEIEQQLGRKRDVRWGPRAVDLDILLYNHDMINTETLTVPHPEMTRRAFVLIPLADIDPERMIPGENVNIQVLLYELKDKEGVQLWKRRNGEGVFGLFEN